jgi:hypothetical protein
MEAANRPALSTGTNHPRAEGFAQAPGDELIALSAVGFNAEKTLATLTIQHDCSPSRDPLITCHRVHQMLLAKKNGRWELVRYTGVSFDGKRKVRRGVLFSPPSQTSTGVVDLRRAYHSFHAAFSQRRRF